MVSVDACPFLAFSDLEVLVSHEFTVCLSVFDLFLTQWIMAILGNC